MSRLVLLVALVAVVGCAREDEVRTYAVPRPKTPPTPAAAAVLPTTGRYVDVSGPEQRLLGLLIPGPDGGFLSVKLAGPKAAVDPQADAFRAFARSVRLTADPKKPLAFDVPPGWTRGPARQMRLDTLLVPGPTPLDVGVFPAFRGTLLENVNRWREQAGAQPVTEADLPTAAPELK